MLEHLCEFTVSSMFVHCARGLLTGGRTGIGPEVFGWITADGNFSGDTLTAQQEAYYQVTSQCSAHFNATEIMFRELDTTRIMALLIIISGPRFWNRISTPGGRPATRSIRLVLPALWRISRSTCRSPPGDMVGSGTLLRPTLLLTSISLRASGMPKR